MCTPATRSRRRRSSVRPPAAPAGVDAAARARRRRCVRALPGRDRWLVRDCRGGREGAPAERPGEREALRLHKRLMLDEMVVAAPTAAPTRSIASGRPARALGERRRAREVAALRLCALGGARRARGGEGSRRRPRPPQAASPMSSIEHEQRVREPKAIGKAIPKPVISPFRLAPTSIHLRDAARLPACARRLTRRTWALSNASE